MAPILQRPQRITPHHKISGFSCGNQTVDDYLSRRAIDSDKTGHAKVYVVCNEEDDVVGYYTISATSVVREKATSRLRRNSPKPIPMALIGMFGVHQDHSRRGIGRGMMKDAIKRISLASDQLGIRGIMLNAIDDDAKSFYMHLGFSESGVEDYLLMVTLQQIAASLADEV